MADIIERLRIESRREPHEPIWRDAIDEIEALRAEVTALQRELGALHMHAKQRDQYAVEKAVQALDWKTRAERLEEALRELSEVCRAAIKAGDWKVDGACDPDSLLSRADAAIYCDVTDNARALLRDQEE
jgi:folylpolyglutamate synthase/dihydropteroate synthase